MGWIISTCILGALFLLALLAFCILWFIADRRITELDGEAKLLRDKFFDERMARNAIVDKANRIIGERNRMIREKNDKLSESNLAIVELKAKIERTNEIIDRLSNSNMNAPQPIMEPQVIQNIA